MRANIWHSAAGFTISRKVAAKVWTPSQKTLAWRWCHVAFYFAVWFWKPDLVWCVQFVDSSWSGDCEVVHTSNS